MSTIISRNAGRTKSLSGIIKTNKRVKDMKQPEATSQSSDNLVREMRILYLTGNVAWQIVVPFALALFGGLWLDGQLGSGRVLTVTLVALSIPTSVYLVARTVRTVMRGLPHGR